MVTEQQEQAVFRVELRPNGSSNLRGVHVFFAWLLIAFLPTGIIFAIVGAWPVFGFMGGELVFLYLALRLSQRRSREFERISITPTELTVERCEYRGAVRKWSMMPQWLRIELSPAGLENKCLNLRSHGKSLAIGGFLTPQERLEVAAVLERELRPVRFV